ncbi:unnamed protein product [Lactuca saligna]|uniref:Ubiquitin-like protease family profile domain-containing protein n=1 Tax=Lactuca saligna TaxID=75948 RepID=A0AA35ZE90_LACSI|nr:unnamed protein product [Lactuca saligna]
MLELKDLNPCPASKSTWLQSQHSRTFIGWFKKEVGKRLANGDDTCDDVRRLAKGPNFAIITFDRLRQMSEPFVLASQVKQVFYIEDQEDENLNVVGFTPHRMYKYGSKCETDDMLEFDATFDLIQHTALLDLDDDFLEKFVVDRKSWKQTLQSIGKKWRNFKHYLYAKFIKNRSKDPKDNLFKPPFITKEDWKVFVSYRGVLNVSEATSCQVGGVIEDVGKEPWDESLDNFCLLAVKFASNVDAKGTIMKYSASDENIEVMMETNLQREALIPILLEQVFIVKVKDALGHILSWQRHLVIRCSDLGKVLGKPIKKHATPVKKDATSVKEGATHFIEEIESNKKEKGIGKMVYEQKEPCDVEEGNRIEMKIKKKEKQNVTLQRRWTRAQMKTRIRIEKSSILKMTAMMADGHVTMVDSINVQSENDLFGYDSYTYLTWNDFEAVLTMDELTGAIIVSYMIVLFNKMKYSLPERDHGIRFVNPTLIFLSMRKGKSKNIDDASRGLADRLSSRKGNDIIFMPYNLGRHWLLGVLDMKSDDCYYLDFFSSSNFNMQLKQIVDSEMVMYATQIGSNKRVKLNWVNVTCPVQPGATECGYYMLRFMKEIMEEGIEVLVKDNIGDGNVEYTTDDIDEIREEWSEFIMGFIYR